VAGFSTSPAPTRPAWTKFGVPAAAAFLIIAAGTASYNWLPVRVQWTETEATSAAAPSTAEPAAPPAPRPGAEVMLDSSPAGATIIVDGKNRGTAPVTLRDLTVGTHTVVFEADGLAINRSVRVRGDQPLSITQDMTPASCRSSHACQSMSGSTDDGRVATKKGRSLSPRDAHYPAGERTLQLQKRVHHRHQAQ
jgi:hypothetical protein